MRIRRRYYERHPERQRRLSKPVISVGNLSMGGTGKTPLVMQICYYLMIHKHSPAILTRGYARADAADGVVRVTPASTLAQAGDEPMMLANSRLSPYVSPDRYLAGRLAERLGSTVHVLDDGFQHLQLSRDLDILVTTAGEIPNGRVIPFGRLREPRDAASSADILIVSGATPAEADAEGRALGVPHAFAATRQLGIPTRVGGREYFESKDAKVFAVAGIGQPAQFAQLLKDDGWTVVDTMWFRDHHRYTARDVAAIDERFRASGAAVVFTTGKDAVRFEALGESPFPLCRVPLIVDIDRPEEFFGMIEKAVS